jgi:hypothetical protein
MMQKESHIRLVPIAIKMIDAISIKQAGAPFDAMDFIAFIEQEFG